MRAAESYDLIVIGDQIGGYVTAVAAAQTGKKVLLVENQSNDTTIFERPSGNFLLDLYWEPLIGHKNESQIDHFCKQIGLYQNIDDVFPILDPALQLIEPAARIDHIYNSRVVQSEYLREYPAATKKEKKFFSMLSFKNSRLKSYRKFVQKYGMGVEWDNYSSAQAALYGNLIPKDMSLQVYHELMARAANGVRYVKGGKDSLKTILAAKLQAYGGKIKKQARVEEIVLEKGKLAGVMLSSFEGFIRSNQIVSVLPTEDTLNLLPLKFRPRPLADFLSKRQPIYWRFTYSITLPDYAIPEGLSSHICVLDKSQELSVENYLQIFLPPKGTYGGMNSSESVLLVRMLVPYSESSLNERFLSICIKRSLKKIAHIVPFLDEEKTKISPNPDSLINDEIYKKYYSFSSLQSIPTGLLVYGVTDIQSESNSIMHWSRFGLKGLYLGSRDIYPLFGTHGEIITAMQLAKAVSTT